MSINNDALREALDVLSMVHSMHRAVIYTDTKQGQQIHRDDCWLITTTEIHAIRRALAAIKPEPTGRCCYGGKRTKQACGDCAAWKPEQQAIQVGCYEISTRGDDTFWIEHESGEGMQCQPQALEKCIAAFYKEHF